MDSDSLIKKIKTGISKSGFPLELMIGKILNERNWEYSIGNIYRDFETGKYRESDIVANKPINGFSVHLSIECKKSDDKQIILYAPDKIKLNSKTRRLIKLFPKLKSLSENYKYKNILEELKELSLFNKNVPFAKSLIVTKGDVVTSDNVNYLSSINGLIKNSIHIASHGYLDHNLRTLFLHIMVFDGRLFQLSDSKTEDFDLKEILYGQYQYEHHFQFESHYNDMANDEIVSAANKFGSLYIVEIMSPKYFEDYVNNLEKIIDGINLQRLDGWGHGWEEEDFWIL